jgi:protein TonB
VFAGFDPHADQTFFERRRAQASLAALLLVGGSLGLAFHMASRAVEEPVEEAIVEAEIQNLELEEELEEEPEPEPPPPEPPSSEPKPRSSKPTPQPDIQNPDEVDTQPEEGPVKDGGGDPGGGGGETGGGGGSQKPEPEPEPKPEEKPKPKRESFPVNPDKPIERPADATVPKQIGGNSPVYPAELRKRNITGKVKVRLTIYKDGSVKAAKVLAKENSIDADAEPDLHAKANALLLKAVAAAVQTWKFKPSTYKGKPISVFLTVTIPFTLE